jgi:hypothetical protein
MHSCRFVSTAAAVSLHELSPQRFKVILCCGPRSDAPPIAVAPPLGALARGHEALALNTAAMLVV